MRPEEKIAIDEAARSLELPDMPTHIFVGDLNRDCLLCGKPDRNPTHRWGGHNAADGQRCYGEVGMTLRGCADFYRGNTGHCDACKRAFSGEELHQMFVERLVI